MLKKSLIPAALIAILPLFASPTAYGQGTPDGETPANEGICDELIGFTPGLYGLCVAFCEAQDCVNAAVSASGDVTFDPSCNPSNPRLLDNYERRANPGDPPMPCLNIVETQCPCWTEHELDLVADGSTTNCEPLPAVGAILAGTDAHRPDGGTELAAVLGGSDPVCSYRERFPRLIVRQFVITDAATACIASIQAECADRGF